MKDLANPNWIKFKGALFLAVGILAAVMLILEQPTFRATLLLLITIWCFCRTYYFAFYVIEHYVDPGFRFSGLWAFAGYLCSKNRKKRAERA